ncbi:MAG: thioredoxin domain-containing protein [Myxococcota bacterium]|nr:thioredoxin domain-containing protein [Myxococcota bacterium]
MRMRSTVFVLLFAVAGIGATCRGEPKEQATHPTGDVELPGVDTGDFTPREKREFTQHVNTLSSPCASASAASGASTAPSIAQCVRDKRRCSSCLEAARLIAKAVRDGLGSSQVAELYRERFDASSLRRIPLEGSPSRGPEDAPVVVVEFADFECPYCQKLAPQLDELWEKRKASVRFVYKFLPLPMHPNGEPAARAAIAAQMQGKFWEMHRELFANGLHLETADLEGYAKAIGLDLDRFRVDMRSLEAGERLRSDKKVADALGIKGTPTIFIDGREYDSKVGLDEWVDGEIVAAGKRPPSDARRDE